MSEFINVSWVLLNDMMWFCRWASLGAWRFVFYFFSEVMFLLFAGQTTYTGPFWPKNTGRVVSQKTDDHFFWDSSELQNCIATVVKRNVLRKSWAGNESAGIYMCIVDPNDPSRFKPCTRRNSPILAGCPDMSSSCSGAFGMKLGTWQKRDRWGDFRNTLDVQKGRHVSSYPNRIFQVDGHIDRNAAFSQGPNWFNVGASYLFESSLFLHSP